MLEILYVKMDNIELCNKFERVGIISFHACEQCGSTMKLVTRKRNSQGNELISLRCTSSKCQRYRSLTYGSFFSLFIKPFTLIN